MMECSPLVSILIPNYNKALYLRDCLESILAQTYSNWECIIVDDHSTDKSWEILEEYAATDLRFQIVKRPNNLVKGGNVCRNHAFKLSNGKFVNWFDSDDFMIKFSLKERIDEIWSSGNDFVVSNGFLWDFESEFALNISRIESSNIHESFLMFAPNWLVPGLIIRKSFIIDNSIIWNEEIPFYQDIFYSLCVLKFGKYSVIKRENWIWRSALVDGLGQKTKNINSYSDNFIISKFTSIYSCFFLKDNYKYSKWFILNKFYILGYKSFWNRNDFYYLCGFFDGISLNRLGGKLKIYLLKSLFFFIHYSTYFFPNLRKSIFYRLTVKGKIKPFSSDSHFLENQVLIKNKID